MNKDRDNMNINEESKKEQLKDFSVNDSGQKMTTNQGLRITDDEHSLKAGDRGPTLMEDFQFREKMTHFDHERIPERIVHARGFGAHGYFQVYEPMAEFTKAKFLQDPAAKTPVFVRFSTVAGSRGSADTVRDVRGFATKFYTEEGNFDLVGNNMPVFFIQDAMKFPDFVHAVKPEPHNEIPQASTAHDTHWDFIANNTESTHMIMWAMSDRAIPRSFRMMEGFGVHTFRFVNEKGEAHFVKFHWKPLLGVHSLVWDEAQKIAGKDPDFNRRDLSEAIEMGNYPEFEFGVQIIREDEEFNFDFDILDPTKLWPEELIPVRRIGKMTLNRNVDNFFAETEQIAFHVGHVVPGIDFSNDPLLQGRLFSYTDTQLSRLGGPNFHEIPINRPLAPVHNNQRDGMHRMTINQGQTSYHKNSLNNNDPHEATEQEGGYVHYQEKVEGRKVRARSDSFKDHYSQAKLFWNSMSDVEQKHMIKAFRFELGKVQTKSIQQQMVNNLSNVDLNLAEQVALGIGAEAPKAPTEEVRESVTLLSPALSQLNTAKSAATRKIAVLAANGFDSAEMKAVQAALQGAGVTAEIISEHLGVITGTEGDQQQVKQTFLTADSVLYDAVYVAGGEESITQIGMIREAVNFIIEAYNHFKTIGAAGKALGLLGTAGIHVASPDQPVGNLETPFTDTGLVISSGAESGQDFGQKLVDAIAMHRHWDRELSMSK
ncbi:catalase [Paenibacillus dokdonensis]|uniref:Catalase n=1 Tax=Paenibacillus dokdonensis TaxID=2567944 RepID=A0ABU6GS37_9BACL|nr:catalase [Paenibacillus dokdonensis]MEC0242159.1 catalase [Paenibacillus dokdonensis]